MGRISGALWIVGALLTIGGAFLPGASHRGIGVVLAASVVGLLYGIVSAAGLIHWDRASQRALAWVMAVTIPAVGVAIYLTGGALSYVQPLLVPTLLYVALFFPPRIAWPLAIELVLVAGAPLIYEDGAVAGAYPSRYVGIAIAFLAVTGVMISLKGRLIAAEAHQREIAQRDPLTGVANRRGFEQALRREVLAAGRDADATPFALILFDLDDFKCVNDEHGHPAGDAVLRATAEQARTVLRSTDLLARIGGDEFAVIAGGAFGESATRQAEAVRSAVGAARSAAGVPSPGASIGMALFPEDGEDFESLMQVADKRLLAAKRNGFHSSRDSGLRLL